MYTELVCNKLYEQEKVYQRFKNGDASTVQYQEFYDKEWGTRDANYVNRERLAYYLLYMDIDDEDAAAKCANDPYSEQLVEEYVDWKREVGLDRQ